MMTVRKLRLYQAVKLYLLLTVAATIISLGYGLYSFLSSEYQGIVSRTFLTIITQTHQDNDVNNAIINKLKSESIVNRINLITPDKAVDGLMKDPNDKLMEVIINKDVLPTLIEVEIKRSNFNSTDINLLKDKIQNWTGVENIKYKEDFINRITLIKESISIILLFIAILISIIFILQVYFSFRFDLANLYKLLFKKKNDIALQNIPIEKYLRNYTGFIFFTSLIIISFNAAGFALSWQYYPDFIIFNFIDLKHIIAGNLVSGSLIMFIALFVRYMIFRKIN